jgi:flavin-dependent dehydrogenase
LVALMTDVDIARALQAKTADGFQRLLSSTYNIGSRRADGSERAPVALAASTSRLSQVAGAGWCAAGDAAATHDPLSAQGIVSALMSGRAAAEAALSGDTSSYARSADEAFSSYLATRQRVYADNQRWPNSQFWRRRSQPSETAAR